MLSAYLSHDPAIPLPGIQWKNWKQGLKKLQVHTCSYQCWSQQPAWVSISGWKDKQNVAYPYSGYYSAIKTSEVLVYIATWIKKSYIKGHIIWVHVYETSIIHRFKETEHRTDPWLPGSRKRREREEMFDSRGFTLEWQDVWKRDRGDGYVTLWR